ncbi:angiopoietin-4-like [Amphibalanus amphitrite]|uniref:angiopoietin-4-like n=1 Tax=Amphibalanus amphitrite TaxID=1232801 RepID=UPI001C923C9A|nr:angiopoietin-4-like [Amphibalanus amphitrite]
MRPLQALLLLPLAGALLSGPSAELWADLSAVPWRPVPTTIYRRVQFGSACQCRAACVANPRCQALQVRWLSDGMFTCSLSSHRRGAAEPIKPPADEEVAWFERAGPPTPEEICWPAESGCRPPTDCAELRRAGISDSGVYSVSVSERPVFCDMATDGGGWTLLQRRGGPISNASFAQPLLAYKAGFGQPSGDHWLGLEAAARLGELRPQLLRVDGWQDDELWFAVYGPIVLDAADEYRLTAPWLEGNTTAELVTPSRDTRFYACGSDTYLRSWSCQSAGWWRDPLQFQQGTNLNGVLHLGELVSQWVTPAGTKYQPTRTELKLRDADF